MRIKLLLTALLALLACACVVPLETAKARRTRTAATAPEQSERCKKISDWQYRLELVAAGGAFVAGPSGVTTIVVDDPDVRAALGITTAVVGVTAGTAAILAARLKGRWTEQCSE